MSTRKKSLRLAKARNVKSKVVTIDLTEESFQVHTPASDSVIILEDSLNSSSTQAATTANTSPKTKEPRKRSKEKTSKSPEVKTPRIGIGDCAICFEQLGSAEICATKCGHVFCLSCLMQSLEFKAVCPTCRHKLEGPGAYHPLYVDFQK